MAQRVKVLAAELNDSSSITGTHIVEGDNQLLQVVLWPLTSECKGPRKYSLDTGIDWRCNSVVEHLLSMFKIFGLILSIQETGAQESQVRCQPDLQWDYLKQKRANEVTQQAKALLPSLMSKAHTVEGENWLLKVAFDLHTRAIAWSPPKHKYMNIIYSHTHTHTLSFTH